MIELLATLFVLYFAFGLVLIAALTLYALFWGNPGEMIGGSWWWVGPNVLLWALLWPLVVYVLVAGEIKSRAYRREAEKSDD